MDDIKFPKENSHEQDVLNRHSAEVYRNSIFGIAPHIQGVEMPIGPQLQIVCSNCQRLILSFSSELPFMNNTCSSPCYGQLSKGTTIRFFKERKAARDLLRFHFKHEPSTDEVDEFIYFQREEIRYEAESNREPNIYDDIERDFGMRRK